VIVETRFRDVERLGDVRIAEAVEPAGLDQALGDVEDALRSVCGRAGLWHEPYLTN
jgi:hypothetical protein